MTLIIPKYILSILFTLKDFPHAPENIPTTEYAMICSKKFSLTKKLVTIPAINPAKNADGNPKIIPAKIIINKSKYKNEIGEKIILLNAANAAKSEIKINLSSLHPFTKKFRNKIKIKVTTAAINPSIRTASSGSLPAIENINAATKIKMNVK